MAWTPDLALHQQELDRQHADLFRLIGAAVTAFETGATPGVKRAVDAFIDAMQAHAAGEEALMEEALYPERGRHRVAHEVFLADLRQLRAELEGVGPTPQVGDWLRIRVPEWLRFHILANDAPLAAHLARRPVAARGARRSDTRRSS